MIRGSKTYTEPDMPIAASFVSDSTGLICWLVPREVKPGPNGTETVIEQSGCRIRFEEGELSVDNSKVLEKMVKSAKFNVGLHGWRPNPEDPTGFWRHFGFIKTETLQVVDATQPILQIADPDERWKALEPTKFKAMKKPENLQTIRSVRL